MRELNTGTHKARRSSFSNTLSGLPEVEEPYSHACSPIPAILEESKATPDPPSPQLPIIADVVNLKPEPRQRIHSLPKVSKSKFQLGNVTRTAIAPNHVDRKAAREDGKPTARTGVWPGELKSHAHYLTDGRRWSIGSPVSRVSPTSTKVKDRQVRTENLPPNGTKNSHRGRDLPEITSPRDDLSVASPLASNKSKTSRKFSDPSLVLDDKDRRDILQDPNLNRRWSNPAFAETAKKVTTILRVGRNMRNKLNPPDGRADQNKTFRTLADLAVEMPKNPRFSAMMSPEAQYSIMMGYEDKIYDRLVTQCPDYQTILKRNKTPVKKVHIRRKNSIGFIDDDEDDDEDNNDEEVSENHGSTQSSFLTQPTEDSSDFTFDGINSLTPRSKRERGSTHSLNSSTWDAPERPDSRVALRNLRRLSVSLEKKNYLDRFFDKVNDDNNDEATIVSYANIPRSYSLPNVGCLPFTRRLMMTHRLESAMDILDAMKAKGEHHLSPRLKARKSMPFIDYTSWVHEWNKEFRIEQGKS